MPRVEAVEDFLREWVKAEDSKEYMFDEQNKIFTHQGEEIQLKIENISVRENQLTTTDTKNNEIKNATQNNEKKFVWLGGFTYSENKAEDREKTYGVRLKDYLFAIEPFDAAYAERETDSYDITGLIAGAKTYFATHPNSGIYSSIMKKEKNKFKASLIRIKDKNGNYTFQYADAYLMSTDNRTYCKSIFNKVQIEYVQKETNVSVKETRHPYNMLVYGAPGTGKSNFLNRLIEEDCNLLDTKLSTSETAVETNLKLPEVDKVEDFKSRYVQRVTFYEDYSYENFVGCYKPVPLDDAECKINVTYGDSEIKGALQESRITYRYEAGPLLDIYVKAKNDAAHNYYLIIEEINRAKAASVFGDIFQLLDRKNGISEYSITPEPALKKYLLEYVKEYEGLEATAAITMRLPNNLYIWATMNSADQGVFTLDSAFKRRWSFVYKDIEDFTRDKDICLIHDNRPMNIKWDVFRSAINDIILSEGYDEDRCIGQWFFSDAELESIKKYTCAPKKEEIFENPLVNKLLYYLRQDVFRMNSDPMFKTGDEASDNMSVLRNKVKNDINIEEILKIDINKVGVASQMKEWKEVSTLRENDEQ